MPQPVPDTLALLADELLADATDVVALVLEDIAATLPDLAHDPRVRELLVATVQDTVVAGLTVFRTRSPSLGVSAPPAGLELARRLAQRGVPISIVLRAYLLGQAAVQQELISRIAARSTSAAEVAAAARDLSSVAFSVIDSISEEVVAAYQAERDDWLRQRNAARLARVTSLLSTRATAVEDLETALGYDLAVWHVGAVFWCEPAVDEPLRLGALERQVSRVAAALGCSRGPLVVAADASTLWVWFPTSAAPVETITAAVAEADTYAAVGDPASGLEGFRRTHQQARQGQTIAVAADSASRLRVTAPSLLGPLALLAFDPSDAAAWVQSVLGELADDDDAHARLRETIWAYLSSGSSLAAAELHLHKNTIQYRIRKAEEARGRPLHDGRVDVEVALLACRLLGSTVLRAVT